MSYLVGNPQNASSYLSNSAVPVFGPTGGTGGSSVEGSGITLSTGANSVDVVPYFVKATNSIQIGAVQKAFS